MNFGAEIHSIVCFVDCSRAASQTESAPVFIKQLCTADLVVFNKRETISDHQMAALRQELRDFITSPVIETTYANVQLDVLLEKRFCAARFETRASQTNSHARDLSELRSCYIEFEAGTAFDPEKVEEVVGKLLWEDLKGRIYRLKGVFGSEDQSVNEVQGYDDVFEVKRAVLKEISQESKFLFIGKQLNHRLIRDALSTAVCYQDRLGVL